MGKTGAIDDPIGKDLVCYHYVRSMELHAFKITRDHVRDAVCIK